MNRIFAAAFAAFAPVAFAATSLAAPGVARADAGTVSTVQLDVAQSGVDATLDMPLAPLERALEKERALAVAGTGEVSSYLRDHVHLACSSDGLAWPARITSVARAHGASDGEPTVIATMHFTRPEGAHEDALELTDDAVVAATDDHRVVVFVRYDFEMGKLDGEPVLAGVLQSSRSTLTLLRADASWARGMRAMFALGTDRLLVGPGLLLLWLVLLTAPLLAMHGHWSGVRTTRGAVRALSAATLAFAFGHALSFGLGSLAASTSTSVSRGMRLPGSALEILTALALALAAFHTVRPLGRTSGAAISALSGAVNGLAFAGTLADVGPFTSTGSVVMFTVGVEGLQIVLVALVAPSLILLRETRMYRLLRAGAASAAGLAALVTLAPSPMVLLVAVVALSLTWLAVVTYGRARVTPRAPA